MATYAGTIDVERLRQALGSTRRAIDGAALLAGSPPGSVEIVVAGKYVDPEGARALVEAGVETIGENRLQDLLAKRAVIGGDASFDFIGHLQRRKVRDVVGVTRLIHSLDSLELAAEISRRAAGTARVLVEVNVASEPTKHGIHPSELRSFLEQVSRHPRLEVVGLMTMPPFAADPETSRRHFAALRGLRDDLREEWAGRHDIRALSMGTSQDYLVAVQEGATMVRIGRGLLESAKAG